MRGQLINFELHKLRREILTNGKIYVFDRNEIDKYGESTGNKIEVKAVRGILHIVEGYLSQNVTEGTVTHDKGKPFLLCLSSEAENIFIMDYVTINGVKYFATGKNNIAELDIVTDISLERFLK